MRGGDRAIKNPYKRNLKEMCDKSAMGDLTSAATAPGRPPNIRFGIPDNSTGLEVKIFNNLIWGRSQEEHLSYTCDIFLLGALYLLMSPT